MNKMMEPILGEFQQEAATTKRVLDRVPPDKLGWKPHPKSMSLGELALHVAGSPANISGWCIQDETTFSGESKPTEATSVAEILATHDRGVTTVKERLTTLGDEGLKATWTAKAGGATLMQMP